MALSTSSSSSQHAPPIQAQEAGFCFPIDLNQVQNKRLKLVPFDSSYRTFSKIHTEQCLLHPDLQKFMPNELFDSTGEFDRFYDAVVRSNETRMWFAIVLSACTINRKRLGSDDEEEIQVEEGTMAGVTGLLNGEKANMSVEIGFVAIYPRFQRTFVATQAHGLMLHYLLDPLPGLHLRRVQWQAHSMNGPSVKAAQRLGFRLEGIIRWQRTLPLGKISPESERRGVEKERLPGREAAGARHSAMLALCWDDWIDGGRERVDELMAR